MHILQISCETYLCNGSWMVKIIYLYIYKTNYLGKKNNLLFLLIIASQFWQLISSLELDKVLFKKIIWYTFGIYLVYIWYIFGIYLVYIWYIFGIYLVYIWYALPGTIKAVFAYNIMIMHYDNNGVSVETP